MVYITTKFRDFSSSQSNDKLQENSFMPLPNVRISAQKPSAK